MINDTQEMKDELVKQRISREKKLINNQEEYERMMDDINIQIEED